MRRWMLASLVLVACNGGDASTGAAGADATSGGESARGATEPLHIVALELAPGLTEVRFDCDPSFGETCNAVDDDCSGRIDDPCGYGGGVLQVTVAWATGVDIDLYVTDPGGDTLSFQRTEGIAGAVMDRSARGQCAPDDHGPRVENVNWTSASPGTYEVVLHYWGECMTNAGPTDVTLSVVVGQQVVGTFAVELAPNQRLMALRFELE